ncbi:hypothetical protein OC844_001453 [Tilletia horrida]|nr:hypothetical protein OC844_001453 [Tilletia horrida]
MPAISRLQLPTPDLPPQALALPVPTHTTAQDSLQALKTSFDVRSIIPDRPPDAIALVQIPFDSTATHHKVLGGVKTVLDLVLRGEGPTVGARGLTGDTHASEGEAAHDDTVDVKGEANALAARPIVLFVPGATSSGNLDAYGTSSLHLAGGVASTGQTSGSPMPSHHTAAGSLNNADLLSQVHREKAQLQSRNLLNDATWMLTAGNLMGNRE